VALALAASFERAPLRKVTMGYLVLLVIGTLGLRPPFERFDPRFGAETRNPREYLDASRNIADERGYYYPVMGLMSPQRGEDPVRKHSWYRIGALMGESDASVVAVRAAGIASYAFRQDQHIIDIYGLSDPLIARLPAFDDGRWRPGHPYRALPAGYIRSHITGENRIEDPPLRAYYDLIRRVTRDPLLSRSRFGAIWELNFGSARDAVDFSPYRYPDSRQGFMLSRHYAGVEAFNADTPVKTLGDRIFVHDELPAGEVEIQLRARHEAPIIVAFMSNDLELARAESEGQEGGEPGVRRHVLRPAAELDASRVDSLMIFARGVDFSHLRFIPNGEAPLVIEDLEIRVLNSESSGATGSDEGEVAEAPNKRAESR
jgi:hypothetical protein